MQSDATMKIVKYTGLFIAVIIVIWLSVAMYKRYITAKKNSPIFLKKPVHATKGKTIESKKIPVMVDGTEYTYSFWIFVNNWNYRNDKPKHVLHRGDSSCKNANPSVWLYPNTNKLMIRFQTYGEQGTDAQVDNSNLYPKYPLNTMNPIDDQSLMKGRNNYVCDIKNIPLQRWVNVSIVLWNRTTDVYINGKLNRSCILAGVPKLNNGDVYVGHEHGSMVLSCMAAYLPEEMIGTSPEADYWLLRSEEAPLENIIEEYNWVSAAEFADSVGADVINSSLSYFDFDMPEWSYDYSEMDGNTAISTIGADIASSKGMIVCNSAGNSGYLVGAPADGDSVMTVGAVDINGDRAGFSSIGPTADGRIKPNVMACGAGATIAVGTSGISTNGYGTSFSSPILAGMITCLWQSHPEMSALEVMESVMESGSFATAPDNYMGWGIPDFSSADSILTSINPPLNSKLFVSAGPSPFKNQLQIIVDTDSSEFINLELINLAGNTIMKMGYEVSRLNNNIIINSGLTGLPQGVYFLKVISKTKAQTVKLLKG